MKLDYNIIWVDDKITTRPFAAIVDNMKKFLTDEFFHCEIDTAKDSESFKNIFEGRNYDLIITDLSLNDGTTGKDVISFIRENKHNHTEIFFYSANTQLRSTELINSNRITFYQLTEGNYKELAQEIIELIKLTISKFQHIVTMRGMIMHETSTLDNLMIEIIKLSFKNNNVNFDKLSEHIYEDLYNNLTEKTKKIDEFKSKGKFKDLTKDNLIFSADYKIKTLSHILKNLEESDFSAEYKEEINTVRNKFAHAILLKDENNGREYFKHGESGLTFDDTLCKKIRKDILKHKENLDNLKNSLS